MITVVVLMTGFFNSSLVAAKNTDTTAPVPEIIECENKGNCEMTPVDTLQQTNNS